MSVCARGEVCIFHIQLLKLLTFPSQQIFLPPPSHSPPLYQWLAILHGWHRNLQHPNLSRHRTPIMRLLQLWTRSSVMQCEYGSLGLNRTSNIPNSSAAEAITLSLVMWIGRQGFDKLCTAALQQLCRDSTAAAAGRNIQNPAQRGQALQLAEG